MAWCRGCRCCARQELCLSAEPHTAGSEGLLPRGIWHRFQSRGQSFAKGTVTEASWSLEFPWSFAQEHTQLLQAGTGIFLPCHGVPCVLSQPLTLQGWPEFGGACFVSVETQFSHPFTRACPLEQRAGFRSFVFADLLSFPTALSSFFLCSSFTIFFEQ